MKNTTTTTTKKNRTPAKPKEVSMEWLAETYFSWTSPADRVPPKTKKQT